MIITTTALVICTERWLLFLSIVYSVVSRIVVTSGFHITVVDISLQGIQS